MKFSKAHAYGNDFLYVRAGDVAGRPLDALARELCDRHTGIGADGLIVYEPSPAGPSMRLFNADGSRSEVSGNGVRGLAAIMLRDRDGQNLAITIHSEGGSKGLVRTGRSGPRQTFRAAMGLPADLRQVTVAAAGESLRLAVMARPGQTPYGLVHYACSIEEAVATEYTDDEMPVYRRWKPFSDEMTG